MTTTTPNHHAHYPRFAGASGLLAALSMSFGRDDDAHLVAELSGLAAGDTVVDIGSGPGAAARYAAKRGATVTGVDPARVMLRVAWLRTHSSKVHFVSGTAESLPVGDDAASVVWSIATVHHWDDIDAGLREVRRALRPGGRFVAVEKRTTPGANGLASHGWTDAQAEAFSDACAAHGFVDLRVGHHTMGRRTTVSVVGIAP